MPFATKVKVTPSSLRTVHPNDPYGYHTTYTKGECPASEHKRKVHVARATHRQTVTTTWSDGTKSVSYTDHCKCQFCGHEWKQEWMTGLI